MEMKRRNTPDGVRIEVVHTGTNEDQNWGAKHVQEWAEEGWMEVGDDTITILTVDDQPDLVYDIKRRPGYYAKATGERIPLSDVAMTQFFGGWTLPWFGLDQPAAGVVMGLVHILIFLGKLVLFLIMFIWVRWMWPRFRYDQLMNLGWKRFVPLALANIVVTATWLWLKAA